MACRGSGVLGLARRSQRHPGRQSLWTRGTEAKRFIGISHEFARILSRNEKTFNTLFPFIGYMLGVGNFLVLYYGGHLVLGGQMGYGELVQFSQYAGMLYGPLRFISFFPRWFTEAMTAAERIFEVIDVDPAVKDPPRPVGRAFRERSSSRTSPSGTSGTSPSLEGSTSSFSRARPSGSWATRVAGKSTLINLIARFYDPQEGRILIDGVDIRDIAQESFSITSRRRVAGDLPLCGHDLRQHCLRQA